MRGYFDRPQAPRIYHHCWTPVTRWLEMTAACSNRQWDMTEPGDVGTAVLLATT